jgi:hypothetical protein
MIPQDGMPQIIGKDSVNVGECQRRVSLQDRLRRRAVLERANDYFQQNTRIADAQSTSRIFTEWRRFNLYVESHSAVLLFASALRRDIFQICGHDPSPIRVNERPYELGKYSIVKVTSPVRICTAGSGRTAEARSSYEKALALIQQEPERQFLQERIRQLK